MLTKTSIDSRYRFILYIREQVSTKCMSSEFYWKTKQLLSQIFVILFFPDGIQIVFNILIIPCTSVKYVLIQDITG